MFEFSGCCDVFLLFLEVSMFFFFFGGGCFVRFFWFHGFVVWVQKGLCAPQKMEAISGMSLAYLLRTEPAAVPLY